MQTKSYTSIKDLTDMELVTMFQSTREEKFFNELFQRHQQNIEWQIRYTMQNLKLQHYGVDRSEAESSIKYMFLKGIMAVDFSRVTDLSVWKLAVSFNQKCKEYRYNKRAFFHSERRNVAKTVYVDAFEHFDHFCQHTPDYEANEFSQQLEKFIAKLSDVEQVLVHCLSDGLTVIEAAKFAGKSVPSMRLIKQKLRRKAEVFGLSAYLS